MECFQHWLELLKERNKISDERYEKFKVISKKLMVKLNNLISSTYKTKNKK